MKLKAINSNEEPPKMYTAIQHIDIEYNGDMVSSLANALGHNFIVGDIFNSTYLVKCDNCGILFSVYKSQKANEWLITSGEAYYVFKIDTKSFFTPYLDNHPHCDELIVKDILE